MFDVPQSGRCGVITKVARSARVKAYLCALATAIVPAAYGQAERAVSEEEVKAAFLYQFTHFVEWPASARAADGIVIGVMGAEAVEAQLVRTVNAKRRAGMTVRRIERPADMTGVHLLYIGAAENARLAKLAAAIQNSPVLIVTEAPDGLERGGMINFVTTDRVQFEVALGNATRAGIRLNARLLSVAVRVRKGSVIEGEKALLALVRLPWDLLFSHCRHTRCPAGSA